MQRYGYVYFIEQPVSWHIPLIWFPFINRLTAINHVETLRGHPDEGRRS